MTRTLGCKLPGRWLGFVAALACLVGSNAAAQMQRPNFIVIMTDDMGYADLSCFGNDRYPTPHIDDLADHGMKLTDFHTNGPVCSPTRAALLTGRYQQRASITDVVFADPERGRRNHGLQPHEKTFARLLNDAGYRTALFGKWHVGYQPRYNPLHHGFEQFHGFVSGNIDFHSHFDQAGIFDWWQGLELKDEPGYTTHLINQHAVRFIEAMRDEPFCLYLAHEAPHAPYQGPNDPPIRSAGQPGGGEAYPAGHVPRAYREMVEAVDQGVGQIVAALRKHNLDQRTLVLFFSDNGGTRHANNGPLTGHKGSLWEGGHRVPAIAWWPGTIAAGSVSQQTAMTMDVLPTLLDLAGVSPPAGHVIDGVSLAPLLLRGEALPERTLFWQYNNRQAVRHGPWKLLLNQPRPTNNPRKDRAGRAESVALYDLNADLSETTNLADQQPEIVARLQAQLTAWQQEVQRGAARQPD